MEVLDWILVVIRWGHALGAVAWVGGGVFYILVLRPAFSRAPASAETNRAIGSEFRGLVNTAIGVLVITGIILSASRLTVDTVTPPYVAVLTLKVGLAVYMFYIVRFLRQRAYPEDQPEGNGWWHRVRTSLTSTTAVLVIGVVVFGLSDVLDALFESSLTE
jgi:putative copper export protein